MYKTLALCLTVAVFSEPCADRSEFCRFIKQFCHNEAIEPIAQRDCALTCGFCKIDTNSTNNTQNGTHIHGFSRNVTEIQRNSTDPLAFRSRTNGTATAATPEKCVFPDEKKLTTIAPNATENVFSANFSSVKQTNETVQTVTVQIKETARRPRPAPVDANDILMKLAQKRRETATTQFPRKITLKELVSAKELELPRITTAKPSTFSVTLAKTLIKGKCFDEYMYCREFATLCTHPGFGDVMASHCTLTCRRCEEVEQEDGNDDENCKDESPDCAKYADVCHLERYNELTRKHCAKTCGHCRPVCRDRHQNCKQFAVDGFCSDEMYTEDERRHLCGATCGVCK